MSDTPRVLVKLGKGGRQVVQFWRLAWEALERDARPRRFVIAPLGGQGDLLVATPEQFRSTVVRGPRADYTRSASWRGETKWARDDRLPGGSYMLDYRHAATGRVLDRFLPLIRRAEHVASDWGDEVDVVFMTPTGPRIDRRQTSLLFP